MDSHPGIVFRSGPAGRRPSLASGPDVWEVARVLGNVDASGEDAIRQTAELTGLTLEQIRTVARYFAEYRPEVDEWLRHVDEDAQQTEASWRRTREPLFS